MGERNTDLQQEKRHPIRVAAGRAGLTPSVVRVWEARYGAVEPGRTESGQRRYSDLDVERLRLLREATAAGRRIGDVATAGEDDLQAMVDEDRRAGVPVPLAASGGDLRVERIVATCLAAVEKSDDRLLRRELERAVLTLTPPELIDAVVGPLMKRIGEMWFDEKIDPAHEHLATVVVRQVLTEAVLGKGETDPDRKLVVATPSGQVHEIGALEAAVSAAGEGWSVVYLGTNLPAAAIARAARESQARAVALSVVYPALDPELVSEIRALRDALDQQVVLVVGGRAALENRDRLERFGIEVLEGFSSFRSALQRLITRPS